MPKVSTNLWFAAGLREAVAFYVSLVPGSAIERSTVLPADSPSGPAGSVVVIEFTLGGQNFMAMEAGPHDPFNDACSIMIQCDTQDEIDRIWTAILDGGGREVACGWIIDRWDMRWQVAPRVLGKMLGAPDRAAAARAAEAMLKMVKLDIAALEDAFRGRA